MVCKAVARPFSGGVNLEQGQKVEPFEGWGPCANVAFGIRLKYIISGPLFGELGVGILFKM